MPKVNLGGPSTPDLHGFHMKFSINGANTRFYVGGSYTIGRSLAAVTPAQDTIYALPFITGEGLVVDTIGFYHTVDGGAGEVAGVGLYGPDATDPLYPGSLLVEHNANMAAAASPAFASATVSAVLQPNVVYWCAFLCGLGAAVPTIRGIDLTTFEPRHPLLGIAATGITFASGYQVASVYGGSMPATFPAAGTPTFPVPSPAVFLRFA